MFDKLKMYQDGFFKEENVNINILGDNYIKKIYSIYNFIIFCINIFRKTNV